MQGIFLSRKIVYFPVKILLSFLIFTELLFFLGPIDYKIPNAFILLIYFVFVNYMLYAGYKSAIKNTQFFPVNSVQVGNIKILKCILLFALLLLIPRIMSAFGISLSLSAFVSHLKGAIESPLSVYMEKLEQKTNPITYLYMFLSPLTFMSIPLGCFYWKYLNRRYKLIVVILVVIEILIWIGIGTRKGIADILLIIVFIYFAKNYHLIPNLRKNRKIVLSFILAFVLFIGYFLYSNLSRYNVEQFDMIEVNNIKPFYANNIKSSFYVGFVMLEGYLCQGYKALGHALFSDFCFSYGLGNSWFFINIAEKLGIDVIPMTYMGELDRTLGIDPMVNWHSIYVWLANDVTFLGVPVVIYYIGKFFAKSWIETLTNRNFFAPAVFALFVLMVFYFFANNQVISFSFIPFFCLMILWKVRIRKQSCLLNYE